MLDIISELVYTRSVSKDTKRMEVRKMNKYKLEEEMKKQGISKEKMCSELGISRSAFYRKCKGKTQFTLEEIQAIVKLLKLDSPVDIFFADKVS